MDPVGTDWVVATLAGVAVAGSTGSSLTTGAGMELVGCTIQAENKASKGNTNKIRFILFLYSLMGWYRKDEKERRKFRPGPTRPLGTLPKYVCKIAM